jgi:hypothetical protein
MTEKQLQDAVLAMARHLGWRCYHTYDSRRSDAGFPDLVLVRGRRLLVAELKRDGLGPGEHQQRWLTALADTPAEVHVWRPANWRNGDIETALRSPEGGS